MSRYRRGQRASADDVNKFFASTRREARGGSGISATDGTGGRGLHLTSSGPFWAKIVGITSDGHHHYHQVCDDTFEPCGPEMLDGIEVGGKRADPGTIVKMYPTAFDHRFSLPCKDCNQLPPGTCGCCYFKLGDTVTLSCPGCDPESYPGFYGPAPFYRCTNFPGGHIRAEFYTYFSLPQFPQWWQSIEISLICHSYNQVTLEFLRMRNSSQCYDHIGHQNCYGDTVYQPGAGGFRDCGTVATTSSCDPLMITIPNLHYKCCMVSICNGPYTLTR